MTQTYSYRLAVADDLAGISKVFEDVAPEVPTIFSSETEDMIAGLVATGKSWVAVDAAGTVVGYALAKMSDGETSLEYAGVSTTARGRGVNSTLISKLKETGLPIVVAVRWNNTSSMVKHLEHLGFIKYEDKPAFADQRTKLRWKKAAS